MCRRHWRQRGLRSSSPSSSRNRVRWPSICGHRAGRPHGPGGTYAAERWRQTGGHGARSRGTRRGGSAGGRAGGRHDRCGTQRRRPQWHVGGRRRGRRAIGRRSASAIPLSRGGGRQPDRRTLANWLSGGDRRRHHPLLTQDPAVRPVLPQLPVNLQVALFAPGVDARRRGDAARRFHGARERGRAQWGSAGGGPGGQSFSARRSTPHRRPFEDMAVAGTQRVDVALVDLAGWLAPHFTAAGPRRGRRLGGAARLCRRVAAIGRRHPLLMPRDRRDVDPPSAWSC